MTETKKESKGKENMGALTWEPRNKNSPKEKELTMPNTAKRSEDMDQVH